MRKTLLFVAFILALVPVARAQRLPELATPDNYQLTIDVNLEKENFTGDETIAIRHPQADLDDCFERRRNYLCRNDN